MLKLVQTDWGVFDLAIDDPADADANAAAATAIYAILFTDAEAPTGRVDDTYDRRGWYEDASAGCGLWYVRRQAMTDKARLEANMMIQTALAGSGNLTDIVVDEVQGPAGSVSSLFLRVAGFHNGRKFLVQIAL
jgi:phage gp46-like protein